jgi:hypothetical protein
MLLTSRKLLCDKLQDIENELRRTLRDFGLRVGVVRPGHFEARVRELVAGNPLGAIVAPLLAARRVLREQFAVLHKMVIMPTISVVRRLSVTAFIPVAEKQSSLRGATGMATKSR